MASESKSMRTRDEARETEATIRRMHESLARAQRECVVQAYSSEGDEVCATPSTPTVSDVLSQVEVRVERLRELLKSPKCQDFDHGPAEDLSDRYLQRLRSLESALDACLVVVERLQ